MRRSNPDGRSSYSPEAIAAAVHSFDHKPLAYRINILVARLCFRGIYFPQMGKMAWIKVIAENARTISDIVGEGLRDWISGTVQTVTETGGRRQAGDVRISQVTAAVTASA